MPTQPGSLALPPLVVTGDVGFLADENAQRLVSIYIEEISETLQCLRQAVEAHVAGVPAACSRTLFDRGLALLRQCTVDVVSEQAAAMQARYPETEVLHRYVQISLLSEAAYAQAMTTLVLPTVAETYHAFARRIAGHPDVRNGPSFLEQPLSARRVVFLDAFRNAMHDEARRYAGRRVTARADRSDDRNSVASSAPRQETAGGSLQAAMLAARARVATESESEAIRSSRAPSLDGQAPPPPAPPVLVGSDERAVLLLDTPLPLPAA